MSNRKPIVTYVASVTEVTLAQARTALRRAGILNAVDAAIRNSGNAEMLDAWEYGNTLHRNSPMLKVMATALSLSDSQVDQLFKDAAAIHY